MRFTVGRKLTFAFTVMAILIGALYLSSLWAGRQVTTGIAQSQKMAAASQLVGDKITDHFKWLDKLNSTFVHNLETIDVQLDDHQCGLGKWLYGEDVKVLAAEDPRIAQLLGELEGPHHALHESGIAIKQAWKQRSMGIREVLWDVRDAHAQWARKVALAVYQGQAELNVELDSTKCAFGLFLQSDAYRQAAARTPDLKRAIESASQAHDQLHQSARNLGERLASHDAKAAGEIYGNTMVTILSQLNEALGRAIAVENNIQKAQTDARQILTSHTTEALKQTQAALENLRVHIDERNQAARNDLQADLKRQRLLNTVVTGIAFLAAIGAGLWLTRCILGPINIIAAELPAIAAGDLTRTVTVKSNDQLGDLGRAFNALVDKFRASLSEVSAATREVASACTEIAASSEEMAAGMREQSEQTTQISASVEEMSASVVEVAKKSAETASTAERAGDQATKGGTVVNSTIDGMNAIALVVQSSSQSVGELGKRGEQIGKIIEVINDIADQTNLLALNAAIEAARAGEHGRGFAVVADEVRKLAERTTHATEEVSQSIKAIQQETGSVVDQMNKGTDRVAEGVSMAQAAGESLQSILAGSKQVTSMIQGIAAAAEEQSAAAEQISRNIESITAVTRQSTEGADQAAVAAAQLSSKAEQLQQLVQQFKIADPVSSSKQTANRLPARAT